MAYEHSPWDPAIMPLLYAWEQHNPLLDHGLEKTVTYISRKNGSYYETIKGGTSTGAGTIVFGGSGNVGGASGTDAVAVLQKTIDALETAAGGEYLIKKAAYPLSTTGLTVEGNYIDVHCEQGTTFTYSGTGSAITLGKSTEQLVRISWSNGTVTGDANTDACFKILRSNSNIVLRNANSASASAGAGILVDGGAGWSSIATIVNPLVSNCLYGIETDNTVNGLTVFGGYVHNTAPAGSKGVYIRNGTTGIAMYGTFIETFVTGFDNDGDKGLFSGISIDACTTGFLNNAGCFHNLVFCPNYNGNGTDYTDNGTNNSVLAGDTENILKRTTHLQSTTGGDFFITLGDNAGANRLYIRDSDNTGRFALYTNSILDVLGGSIKGVAQFNTTVAGNQDYVWAVKLQDGSTRYIPLYDAKT